MNIYLQKKKAAPESSNAAFFLSENSESVSIKLLHDLRKNRREYLLR